MASRLSAFLAEAKRRKVYRVAAAYVIGSFAVLSAAEVTLDPLGNLCISRPTQLIVGMAAAALVS